MNSIQPTEWEKQILEARKQNSETELFVIDFAKLAMKWHPITLFLKIGSFQAVLDSG